MKNLYSYIVNEGIKDAIDKLKSLFKKKEKQVYKTGDERWEKVQLLYYNILKAGPTQSFSNVRDLVNTYMDGAPKYELAVNRPADNKRQYAAFIQGVLDYAYMNYTRKLKQDPYGEISCDRAIDRACKEYGYEGFNHELDRGAVGLDVYGFYPYGWGFAERLGLQVSRQWLVSFKTAEPIN